MKVRNQFCEVYVCQEQEYLKKYSVECVWHVHLGHVYSNTVQNALELVAHTIRLEKFKCAVYQLSNLQNKPIATSSNKLTIPMRKPTT